MKIKQMGHGVLIVDDSEQSAATLHIALSGIKEVEVTSVRSAEEALELLSRDRQIRAVITDIQMPGMDGYELIGHIRRRHAALPVIVISGIADDSAGDRVRRLGATAFFSKPYSPALVRRTIEQLLS